MPTLHAQLLMLLGSRIEKRLRELEGKVGLGLPDQEYQRHVGRIAECKHWAEHVEELSKADIDTIEDLQEEEQQRERQRASRVKRRS